jgi:uncharacterized protein YxeA
MFKLYRKLLTKNNTKIPLLYIMFNLKQFREQGKEKSCILHIHPSLRNDEYIIKTLNGLVDYIRNNYDMEDM